MKSLSIPGAVTATTSATIENLATHVIAASGGLPRVDGNGGGEGNKKDCRNYRNGSGKKSKRKKIQGRRFN